jgi:Rad51
MMTQNLIVKPTMAQPLFSLNMPGVDELFPGFAPGDFAVLYGSPSVISLTSLLCIRAQLPAQLGGLGSNVVFIDGGNTFRLYKIARLAQLHQLNPREVLDRIFISRAFTAYQLTSLILDKLEETIQKYNAKLVVISDIAGFFLDNDIPHEEAQRVYSQIISYLSSFAKKHQIIIIATYLPYSDNKRSSLFQEITCSKANAVLSFSQTMYTRDVALEKHPFFVLGTAELPSENLTLTDFMGA